MEQLRRQNESDENSLKDKLEAIELELNKTKDKKAEVDNKIMATLLEVKAIKDKMQEIKSIKDYNRKMFLNLVKDYKRKENHIKKVKENIDM